MNNGWIGVDLDGTLAEYTEFTGETHIGKPVPLMVARVKAWLSQGKEVRIFTARVADLDSREDVVHAIHWWCIHHIGKQLRITHKKDHKMIELWDDRAKQVIPNTGKLAEGPEWAENLLEEIAKESQQNAVELLKKQKEKKP